MKAWGRLKAFWRRGSTNRYAVEDIFTPNKPATHTYIERTAVDELLSKALDTPGKQIVIYGKSGTGKTTLVRNKLAAKDGMLIWTRCMSSMTFRDCLIDAFDSLEVFYDLQVRDRSTTSKSRKAGGNVKLVQGESTRESREEHEVTSQRVLPPSVTPARIASEIGTIGASWILEDFHKLPLEQKKGLSQVMKIFMDISADYPSLKIIAIGAAGTAREVVALEGEMKNRVAELGVPLMTESELRAILTAGEDLLNIQYDKAVADGIVAYSSGLAGVCHQLALNCCLAANVFETAETGVRIGWKAFEKAILQYIEEESDTTRGLFERATKTTRERKYDNRRIVLRALSRFGFAEGATHAEMLSSIRQEYPEYPPGNLSHYLDELRGEERGALVVFDESAGKYRYASPFFHVYAHAIFATPLADKSQVETGVYPSIETLVDQFRSALQKAILGMGDADSIEVRVRLDGKRQRDHQEPGTEPETRL